MKNPANRGLMSLILPTFPILVAITVLPIIVTFVISLFYIKLTSTTGPVYIGLENYAELFTDDRFRNSLVVTVELIFIPVSLQIVIGLMLAMILKERLPGMGWMRVAFLLPAVIPPAVSGLVWKLFIAPGAGGLTYGASLFGVDLKLDLLSMPGSALSVIIAASVWIGTPFLSLLMLRRWIRSVKINMRPPGSTAPPGSRPSPASPSRWPRRGSPPLRSWSSSSPGTSSCSR